MFRTAVCLMIVLLSFGAGYLYCLRFSGRMRIIKDAGEKFASMESHIMFAMDTIPDICRKLSEEGGTFSKTFGRISMGLYSGADSFEALWTEGVKKELCRSFLKKEQVEELALLGNGIGRGDIDEQKKCFARIDLKIEKMIKEAEEESKRLKKMYMSLFISGGMALSIILI